MSTAIAKHPSVYLLTAALLLSVAPGCSTYYGDARTKQVAAEREDMLLVREELRRVAGQLEALEMEYDQLRHDQDFAGRELSRAAGDETSALRRDLADLADRISALESARQHDRDQILDQVSETVTQLMKKSGGPVRKPRRPTSDYGYEHTVESGQTLSEIAKTYGVSTAVIIDANDLQDPNHLRVGQTLFVPE